LVVLASGEGSNLQALLDACAEGALPAQIALVLSDRPEAAALQRARRAGVPAIARDWLGHRRAGGGREGYDRALADLIARHNPDLVVLAGWMRVLSPAFVEAFAGRLFNLHPALPGAFPGTDAIARAHAACQREGLRQTGVMVHHVVAEVDAGPPVAVATVALDPAEALADLAERMHAVEHRLLVEAVAGFFASIPNDRLAALREVPDTKATA
jgi:formyltetrahydrofolate-dependent phosphoribosylglycinamide formyltransferase